MAATTYFEETVEDKKNENVFKVKFGRSNYYKEESMYLEIDGKLVIMDREMFVKIAQAMHELAQYTSAVDL